MPVKEARGGIRNGRPIHGVLDEVHCAASSVVGSERDVVGETLGDELASGENVRIGAAQRRQGVDGRVQPAPHRAVVPAVGHGQCRARRDDHPVVRALCQQRPHGLDALLVPLATEG